MGYNPQESLIREHNLQIPWGPHVRIRGTPTRPCPLKICVPICSHYNESNHFDDGQDFTT